MADMLKALQVRNLFRLPAPPSALIGCTLASRLGSEEVAFIPIGDRAASIDLVIAWSRQHERPVVRAFVGLH